MQAARTLMREPSLSAPQMGSIAALWAGADGVDLLKNVADYRICAKINQKIDADGAQPR